jgi:isopentenyl-diphosphate delta-isomerase
MEEMGLSCELHAAFRLLYQADLGNSMIEHELDHVLVGRFDGIPAPSATEVDGFRWVSLTDLRRSIADEPEGYTFWLKLLLESSSWIDVDRILERTDGQR